MGPLHRSFLFSTADRYGSLIVQIGAIAVLSRLLTPREFGIYSIIIAISALAHTFREFGGANYLIQKRDVSLACIRTAFTVSLVMSGLFAAALLALREVAVVFFSEEGLSEGISVSCINFILLPFSVTISALLRREMAFDALARCNLAANVATAVASVGLAALGLGFMGPLWGSVVGNVVLVGLLVARWPQLRIFRPSLRNSREVIAFGAYSSGTVIINVLYTWSPQIILGRVLDMAAVGLYSRSFNVIQLFDKLILDVINPVVMPIVAAQARAGGSIRRLYLDALEIVAALHWPFLIFVALMADPIVHIIFGAQWVEIVPLVRLLAVASLSLFAACLTYPILASTGRVRDTLTISLISVPPSLVVMFIASFFGINAVGGAALLTLPLQAYVAMVFISRRIGLTARDLAKALWKGAVVAAFSAAGVLLAAGLYDFNLELPPDGLLVAALASAAGWCCGLLLTKHPLWKHFSAAIAAAVTARRTTSFFTLLRRPYFLLRAEHGRSGAGEGTIRLRRAIRLTGRSAYPR
ncbi:MAG: oligosaccharide flippase family protein [Rhodospirillales bacterium]|jgi:O-antigen/teichoic acid export membrane protein|nr:oligosaccharide flippase family protein [Rhodospirillales bacterium]